MQFNYSEVSKSKLKDLVAFARIIGINSLSDAADTDAVDSFPEKTLLEITAAKLLTASISQTYGGQDLGLVAGTNLELLTILKHIGSGNLVMGRVLEGHINAQILIQQFGSEEQNKKYALDAFEGRLFGVWNTQADDGTSFSLTKDGNYLLNGAKTFATGAGYVSRPIITAALPNGSWQMCVVPLDEVSVKSDSDWWHPMGMRASRSYKITFDNIPITADNLLGEADTYYRQPAFSGGAIRFAAVQLGAAEMLLNETRKYLRGLGRTDDPYQKMRLGQMAIAAASGNLWLQGAAQQLDSYMSDSTKENSERFLAYANMMRTTIEQICVEVMALCQKSVGARGLNKPFHFERVIRDLNTYLRQPAPDAALADIGQYVLQTDISASELWNSPNKIKSNK